MLFKCIESFLVDLCDYDGFKIENEHIEIEKGILKVSVDVIKYCGACNRKIDHSETCYRLENKDEVCSECYGLY